MRVELYGCVVGEFFSPFSFLLRFFSERLKRVSIKWNKITTKEITMAGQNKG